MKRAFILGLIVFNFGLPAVFARKINEQCMIRGWVQDKDLRKDIMIYQVPSFIYAGTHDDPFVGYLDNSTEPGEEKTVEIIGYKGTPRDGKWIKIRKATDSKGNTLFDGVGWLDAKRVTAGVWNPNGKSAVLYQLPRLSSKKMIMIPNKTLLEIVGFDCFGLKVKYQGKTGWLSRENICGNPAALCF